MSNSPSSDTGSVVSLWRYPVKSMMGEELHTTSVTDGGLLGDRVYAVIDQFQKSTRTFAGNAAIALRETRADASTETFLSRGS